jgi:hypothetical protein
MLNSQDMLRFAISCAFSLFHKVFKFNIYSFNSKSLSSFFSKSFSILSHPNIDTILSHPNIDRQS